MAHVNGFLYHFGGGLYTSASTTVWANDLFRFEIATSQWTW